MPEIEPIDFTNFLDAKDSDMYYYDYDYDDENEGNYGDDYMQLPSLRTGLIICYSIVFIAGNVSNVAMLVVCLRQWIKAVRLVNSTRANYQHHISSAVTNAFVANLAVADIILCVFSLTSTPYSYYALEWPFGDFMCRFTPSTLILAVCVISFTSTVMAVDRHISIRYPHSRLRLDACSSVIAIVAVWFASLLTCAPIFLSYHTRDEPMLVPGGNFSNFPETIMVTKCAENWPSETLRQIFSICVLFLQFALPAGIIAFCYIGIFVTLQKQKKFRMGRRTSTKSQGKLLRTTIILVAMVAIFMACWMPINILLLLADYYTYSLWHTSWFSLTYFASHLLAMTTTLWNPLLYGWLNERLRPEILKICLFPCFKRSLKSKIRNNDRAGGFITKRTDLVDGKVTTKLLQPHVAATCQRCGGEPRRRSSSGIGSDSAVADIQLQDGQKIEPGILPPSPSRLQLLPYFDATQMENFHSICSIDRSEITK